MKKMNIVYIVRPGDYNEELRISLRSIAKFAPKADVWIVGYKPSWVTNVSYIPKNQINGSWVNARYNLITACRTQDISDNFILMNDDFILTRPIKSWKTSVSKAQNTIDEQIAEWKNQGLNSRYTRAFSQLKEFFSGRPVIYNYELHMPMIINKNKFIRMFDSLKVREFIAKNPVYLYRSLYGNLYNVKFNKLIDDVKFYNGDPKEITTEWISVFDNWVGNCLQFPMLNKWIMKNLSEPCIYEENVI